MARSLLVLVLLGSVALAQDAKARLAQAESARDEGVALFKKKDFAKAADKYDEAIRLYAEALGKDSKDYLDNALVLHRATAWCRAQAEDFDAAEKAFVDFYDDELALGASTKEDLDVRDCLAWCFAHLAKAKAVKRLDGLYEGYCDTVRKAAERAKGAEKLAGQLQADIRLARARHFEALFVAGDRERGLDEYRKLLSYWREHDHVQAAWTSQDAFYEMTQGGAPEDAQFFLIETLEAIKEYDLPSVEIKLHFNLRDYLVQLQHDKACAQASRLLLATRDACKTGGVFTRGISEEYLACCLIGFLAEGEDWTTAAANGEALRALGEKDEDRGLQVRGLLAAGEALRHTGDAKGALTRLDRCIEMATAVGDTARIGRAWVQKALALSDLGSHADAEKAARKAIEAFEAIHDFGGRTEAEQAGLANARAAKDNALVEEYEGLLRTVAAAGGMGGVPLGSMHAAELVRRVRALPKLADVMEVTRKGDRLLYHNLFDDSVAEEKIEPRFHYVNFSGALFQVKGAELQVENIKDSDEAPGTEGEAAMSIGGEQLFRCTPDMEPFRMSFFLADGEKVRLDSAARLYRVKP